MTMTVLNQLDRTESNGSSEEKLTSRKKQSVMGKFYHDSVACNVISYCRDDDEDSDRCREGCIDSSVGTTRGILERK